MYTSKGTSIINHLLPSSPVELFSKIGVLNCVLQRVGDRIVVEHIFLMWFGRRDFVVVVVLSSIEAGELVVSRSRRWITRLSTTTWVLTPAGWWVSVLVTLAILRVTLSRSLERRPLIAIPLMPLLLSTILPSLGVSSRVVTRSKHTFITIWAILPSYIILVQL